MIQVDDPQYPVARVKVAPDAGDATSARHEPFAVNVSPTTGEVWVSSLRSGEVQVLDPVSLTITRSLRVGGGPVFGTFSRDGSRFYVPHQVDDRVSVIRTDTGEIVERISVPSESCRNVHWIELTPDERYGLLLCEGDHVGPGTLLLLDMQQSGAVLQTVPVGVFPDFVGILRRPQP